MNGRTIVLAAFSDTHCGSTVGLIHPDGLHLDDGGSYTPSRAQKWLWGCWENGWRGVESVMEREAKLGNGTPWLGMISNGDATDGDHHRTPQIFTNLEGYHIKAATEAMRVPLKLKPEKLWVINGTEAHVGRSGGLEEGFAVALDREGAPVVRFEDGEHKRWSHRELRAEFNGKFFDFRHHGRMGQRAHTRGSYARLYAHDIWAEYEMRGDRAPDVAVRSHNHTFEDSGPAHPTRPTTRVVSLPCFQLATSYIYRIAAEGLCDVGLCVFVVRPDGETLVHPFVTAPERGPIWKA